MTDYETEATAFDNEEHLVPASVSRVQTTARMASHPGSILAVPLDGADIDRLQTHATQRGISPTQLAREWILTMLDEADSQ